MTASTPTLAQNEPTTQEIKANRTKQLVVAGAVALLLVTVVLVGVSRFRKFSEDNTNEQLGSDSSKEEASTAVL